MAAEGARGAAGGIARQAGWFLVGALAVCGGFSLFLAGMRGVPCADALWQACAGILLGALLLLPAFLLLGCGGRPVRISPRRRRFLVQKAVIPEGGVWHRLPIA